MFSQGFILPSKAKTLEMDVVPCGLHVLTPGPRRAKFGYSSGPWGIFLFSKENNYEVLVGFSVCLCMHSCWLKKLKILAWKSWFYKSRLNFEGKKNDMDITYIKNIHIDILMWTFIFPSDFFFNYSVVYYMKLCTSISMVLHFVNSQCVELGLSSLCSRYQSVIWWISHTQRFLVQQLIKRYLPFELRNTSCNWKH